MPDATKLSYPLTSDDVVRIVRRSVPNTMESVDVTSKSGSIVAIGSFDGLHKGHRELVKACVAEARKLGAAPVVVTFDPDPAELLIGERAQRRLLAVADRVALCQSLGVERVCVIPFTAEFSQKSPLEFVEHLQGTLDTIASVHVGANFHFGCGGSGDVDVLQRLGKRFGFRVTVHPLLEIQGAPVSSTRIRALLAQGRVSDAAALLCRHHFIRGVVAHGRGEGTAFGFPTANVRCDVRSCMPCEGVYACIVTDGRKAWPAAANVGTPPTFDSRHDSCFLEANLIGFEGNL